MTMIRDHEEVLDFWFGDLDDQGLVAPEYAQRWWRKSPEFDNEIRDRFGATLEALAAGDCHSWLETTRGHLAAIVVLDQFSRNLFRDQGTMYAHDARAQTLTEVGVALGRDRELPVDHRVMFYMPLMHSESLVRQERSVALFGALRDELSGAARQRLESNFDFAVQHRDIVARFGRFPHRNALLGRASTPAELAFLREPGSSF